MAESRQEKCIAPETMVNCIFITIFAFYHPPLCPDGNRSCTGGRWSRSPWAWWWLFTQNCIYINRKCRRGKSCLCKLGKKKCSCLKSEKWNLTKKEEMVFHCWDIVFHILAWLSFTFNFSTVQFIYVYIYNFKKIVGKNNKTHLPGLF